MKIIMALVFALVSLNLHAKDLTNCVQQGSRITCVTETLEEANTPQTYNKMGGGEWCLVSNGPVQKYSCSYATFDSCQAAANSDNNYKPVPVSSCIRNSQYR